MNNNLVSIRGNSEKMYMDRIRWMLLFVGIAIMLLLLTVLAGNAEEAKAVHRAGNYNYIVLDETKKGAIIGYDGSEKEVVLPSMLDGIIITDIESRAFQDNDIIQKIVIPDSVNRIGDYAFADCNSLKTVILSNTISEMGIGAFMHCSTLQDIEIPKSVSTLSDSLFFNCKDLQSVSLPNGITTIGESAFGQCDSLQAIVIPDSVVNIGASAFHNCFSLQSVTLSNNIKTINEFAFCDADQLQDIIIPDSVEIIGDYAFAYGSLQHVSLSNNLTKIGDGAFRNNQLRSLFIPKKVESIGWNAFGGNDITTLHLPKSLKHISGLPFDFSEDYNIFYSGTESNWHDIDFEIDTTLLSTSTTADHERYGHDGYFSRNADGTLMTYDEWYSATYNNWLEHLHFDGECDTQDDWAIKKTAGVLRKTDNWKLFWELIWYEDQVGNKYHSELSINLTGDSSDESQLIVYDDKDQENAGLNQPWISETGFAISDIETIIISGNDTTSLLFFQNYFKNYNGLKTVYLSNVNDLSSGLFENCTSLQLVSVDNTLRKIRSSVFKNDKKLVVFGVGGDSDDSPLSGESTLDYSVYLSNLDFIGKEAFYNTSISKLYLSPSLATVEDSAFEKCSILKIVKFAGSPSQWKTINVGENNKPLTDALVFLNGDPYYVNGHKYDYNLDYYVSYVDSSTFDNDLCHLMCDLACVAYDDDEAPKAFTSLGFSKDSLVEKSFYGFGIFKDLKSYRINKKTTTDGNCIVLIDITGSHDILNPKSRMDWLTDFAVAPPGGNNYSYHNGFDELSSIVFDTLKGYLNVDGSLPSSSKTKYFITGHSLGAGVANLLAAKISSEVGKEDVYCYDFACPDTAITTEDPSRTKSMDPFNRANSRDNIFNICDLGDIVTYVPGEAGSVLMEGKKTLNGDGITNFHFGKLGITMWFADGVYDRITVLAHSPKNYVEHLPNDYSQYFISNIHPTTVASNEIKEGLDNIKTDFVKVFTFCPVDMYLIDETGNVLASVEDNKPSLNNSELDILVMTSDDKACIIYPKKQNYSLKLIGTAAGKMTYVVGSGSGDNVNINEAKLFSDVLLEKGKTMISDPIEEGIDETNLYVTNEDETPFKEIHEDGTETKIGVTDLAIRSILVERDEDDFTVKPGASKQIKVVFKNADRDIIEKSATWTSSNEQIATVSPTGLVTAITEGSVTITVSVDDQSLDIPITVSKNADDTTPSTPTSPPSENNEPVREGDGDKTNDMPLLAGIVKGPDGKWAMYKDGKVDTSYNGIAKNQYGWWRVKDGYVDFNANGIYKNEYGWWKTTNGKVTFKETGIFKNEYGWWRVEKSKVNFKADGVYKNQYGWWKTTGGKVTFKENGVFKNEYGWWKVKDSKVDFSFTGIAKNKYGSWYVKDGKVDFKKNGKVNYNNHSYIVKSGKVQ